MYKIKKGNDNMNFDPNRYKYFTDDKNKLVVAASTYAGRTVRGVAKCSDGDTFDLEKGKELAAARCNLKVAEKRLNRARKKLDESNLALDKAQDYYDKMCYYYDDAAMDVEDAEKNLLEILNKL